MCRWEWVDKAQISWFLLHQINVGCFQTLLIYATDTGSHAGFAEVGGNAKVSGEPHGEGWFALVSPS